MSDEHSQDAGSDAETLSGDDHEELSPVTSQASDDDTARPSKRSKAPSQASAIASRGRGRGALLGSSTARNNAAQQNLLPSAGPASGRAASLQPHSLQLPLRKATGNVKAPFKLPIRNYVPPPDKPVATLGPRKQHITSSLLARITHTVVNPEADVAAEVAHTPLCVYDPETDEDETRQTTYKKVFVEPAMAAKLRPHQREGVTFMFQRISGLAKGGFTGAILMDGMGLGKTFQSICTMWTLLNTGVEGKPTCTRALILCPSSLVVNWGSELKKWIGQDRVLPVVIDDTRAAMVEETLGKIWVSAGGRWQGKPQVLIMSYTTFRTHKDAVCKKKVDLVMCDEAHFMKNGDAQITQAVAGLPAARRLLLSGTPVQNDLMEFYALFNVAVPGLLGEKPQFKRRFELPIIRGQDADATEKEQALSTERLTELLQMCNTYMLRRCCGVMAKYLPQKIEQVVFCKMSPLQTKLYNHFYKSQPVQFMLQGGRPGAAAREAATAAAAMATDGSEHGAVAPATASTAPDGHVSMPGDQAELAAGKASGKAAKGTKRKPPASGRAAAASTAASAPAQPELTVLAAITAVRKLCCHPDLIYQMEVTSGPPPLTARQAARASGAAAAPPASMPASGRLSGPALSQRPSAGVLHGRPSGGTGFGRPSGVAVTQAVAAGSVTGTATAPATAAAPPQPERASGAAATLVATGATQPKDVITGFEGCMSVFGSCAPHPYIPNKCEPQHSGKILVLVHMLRSIRAQCPTDKVVLVSNFTTSLDILGTLAEEQRWPWLRLDGNLTVKKRQALVDTFNDPAHPSFLLLLSSKAGGVGLNIIGANRLILFDPDWNPANDLQAMARVWREGQKKRVFIYRLLTTGTLEEKVYQRQLMKQGLSKSIVDDSVVKGQFSHDELKSLFKINAGVLCDTHKAIKCSCDGQLSTMTSKADALRAQAAQERLEAQQQKGGTRGNDDEDEVEDEASVMDWAHLADVQHSPDGIWKHVPVLGRKCVSYLFSDHITGKQAPVAETKPAEEDEEDEQEDEGKHKQGGHSTCDEYDCGYYE